MSSSSSNSNKIAIIGAGPSGLALAVILEKQGGFDYVLYESGAEDVAPRGGWYAIMVPVAFHIPGPAR